MARLFNLLGITALAFAVACGSEESQPSGPNGNSGTGGTAAAGGAGGSAGTSGASGTAGTSGGAGGRGGSSGTSSGTGGAGGAGGSTGGTDGSSGTGGSAGGTGGSGATGGTAGVGGTAGISGTGGTGGVNTPYPAGPYGKTVGATMENYQFTGYVNDAGTALSNTMPLRDYSFDDLRKSGARYALIHLSAYYCAGCKSAAEDLGNLSAPVQQAGGRVIEVLFRGNEPGSAPAPVISAWINTYDLMVTTIMPKAGNTLVANDGMRENAYIVDLTTMKIVWTVFGSYGPTTNSSAKQGVAEMRRLMGI